MTQQKSTNERIGVVPARFQGALDAARPSRFQGIVGNGFSAWLGRRWGLSGGRAPAPVAKSFRQRRNPFAFGRWPRPAPSAPAHYAFFPTLSLAVVFRPMASLLPAATWPPAPERPSGAALQIQHEWSNNYAFSPTLTLAVSLRSMVSQFSAAPLRPTPERRNEFTLPVPPRERLREVFQSFTSRQTREWSHRQERSREQTWAAFLREAGALATSISIAQWPIAQWPVAQWPVAQWFETPSPRALAAPAAMLKLVVRQPLLFHERLVAPMGRENQPIGADVPAAGAAVSPRFAAGPGAGQAAPGLPALGWGPRAGGLLVQAIRTGNRVRDEAALFRPAGQTRARANGAGPVLSWQTSMRRLIQTSPLNVAHLWPAPLPARVGTNPTRIAYQVNLDGRGISRLVLVGAHSMLLAHQLPGSGRRAVKLAMAGTKTATSATEAAATAPPLAYVEPLTSGEATAQGAASFNQMADQMADQVALHYQQREALEARNMSEALRDLRQSLSDFKQAPSPVPAPPPIDQMTRQVYDQLKRELRIERERRGL